MSPRQSDHSRNAARLVKQDQTRDDASFDAYPDRELPPPRVQLVLVAVEEDVPYDAERVDTDGLSAREFIPGLATDARRRWLAARVVEAHRRLLERIGPAAE